MRWLDKTEYLPLALSSDDDLPLAKRQWARSVVLCVIGLVLTALLLTCWSPLFSDHALYAEGLLLAEPGWRPFYLETSNVTPSAAPTLAQQLFDDGCADAWIASGELCEALYSRLGEKTRRHIDVVIPWVNGSTPLLASLRAEVLGSPTRHPNHFREHKELIHNIRAIVASIPSQVLRRIYILTADVEPPLEWSVTGEGIDEDLRIGQMPTWLDLSQEGVTSENAPELHVLHHSQFFRRRTRNSLNDSLEAQDAYLDKSVPSFNSMAIETALGNIEDLAEHVFYSNDDLLPLRELSTADFATPLYGPQFREAAPYRIDSKSHGDSDGEYPSMGFASALLDARFGARARPYLSHGAKVISTASLRETGRIWAEEFDEAGTSRFRGAARDLNANFLNTHYHVEKSREALLWSLLMARFDADHDGRFDSVERATLLAWLRAQSMDPASTDDKIPVHKPRRDSSQHEIIAHTLGRAGFAPPRISSYAMTSMDGFAYSHDSDWPLYPPNDGPVGSECSISLSECFGESFFNSTEVSVDAQATFKRVVFGQSRCGDCLLAAGLTASGYRGLEAFLPPSTRRGASKSPVVPQLGSTAKNWQEADFSVASALGTWPSDLRSFCVRLIQRYQYAIGNGAEQLVIISAAFGLGQQLFRLSMDRHNYRGLAYVALNDDVGAEQELPEVNKLLIDWMEQEWPTPTRWETSS